MATMINMSPALITKNSAVAESLDLSIPRQEQSFKKTTRPERSQKSERSNRPEQRNRVPKQTREESSQPKPRSNSRENLTNDPCSGINNGVVIRLSQQKMNVCKDGITVFRTAVSTGGSDTPTHVGIYSINEVRRNTNLIGSYKNESWNVPVDAFRPFNRGQGLYQGIVTIPFASHGCVRYPWRVNKILDQYQIGVGSTVKITNN